MTELIPTYKGQDARGMIWGGYTVIARSEDRPSKGYQWWVVSCNNCGVQVTLAQHNLYSNKYGCRDCGRKLADWSVISGKNNHNYSGGKYITGLFFYSIKTNFKKNPKIKDLDFTITIQSLDYIWERQNGRCAYTGIPLKFKNSLTEQTASLDRIDSNVGYIDSNVQFIHKDINRMKTDFTEKYFLELVQLIAKEQGY